MKKHLIVLLALVILLNGVFLSATRAEELSLFGGMLALSGLQNQITPGQEQELTAIMEYLGQDLTEENALDEFMAWDKDKILQKLEGYDVPLEYFESKEQAAGFIADVIAQILSIF